MHRFPTLLLLLLLAPLSRAFSPSVSPLSCTDLTAVSCVAKGLSQCCIAGGDCCGDGTCCGVGQMCLASGSGYECCNSSSDCPSASSSAAPASGSPFHAMIPCSPAEGDSWYCQYGQSCGFSEGSCIGVALGGGGSSSSIAASSTMGSSPTQTTAGSASSSPSPSSNGASRLSGGGNGAVDLLGVLLGVLLL